MADEGDRSTRDADKATFGFEHDLFPAELVDINRRRTVLGLEPCASGDEPSARKGLVGLALSGGGIRSATLSLGAIQALQQCGAFRLFDYLSTVSGGGFIGGCVSSVMNDPAVRSDNDTFPLHAGHGAKEPPAVRHVRNSGHYLAPGGLLDRLRIPAIFLRGLVLNAVALVPVLMVLTIATKVYYDFDPEGRVPEYVGAVAIAIFVLAEFGTKVVAGSRTWSARNRIEAWFSLALLMAIIALLMPWMIALVGRAKEESPSRLLWQVTDFAAQPHWSLIAMLAVLVLLATAAQFSAAAARLRTTLLLWAVGLSGPVLFFAAYLVMCIVFIEPAWLDTTAFVMDRQSSAEAVADLQRGRVPVLPVALARAVPLRDYPGRTRAVPIGSASEPLYEAARIWPADDEERGRIVADLNLRRVPAALQITLQDAEDIVDIDQSTFVDSLEQSGAPAAADADGARIWAGAAPGTGGPWRLVTRRQDAMSNNKAFIVTAAPYDFVRVFWAPMMQPVESRIPDRAFGRLAHVDRDVSSPGRWTLMSAGRSFELNLLYGRLVVSWDLGEELNRESEEPEKGIQPLLSDALATKRTLPDGTRVDHAQLASRQGMWFLSAPAGKDVDGAGDRLAVIRQDRNGGGYKTDLRKRFPADWQTYVRELFYAAGWFVFFNYFIVSINPSAFHRFYRDRLSRAYLIKRDDSPTGGGSVLPNDQQRLAALNEAGTCAPYHLINACLNLNGATDPDLRGRQADFFLFSRNFTGSKVTGYCRTADLERQDPHIDLGTAMAISGGAASPNAGAATVKQLVFLLTLLNIRMGYWMRHPRLVVQPWYAGRRLWTLFGAGSLYLLREATGAVSSSHPFINVSDGAHIENLAIYELLRRRCKVIVALDNGSDPQLLLEDLMRLIMLARVELGVEIDIDLRGVEPRRFEGPSVRTDDAAAGSRSHFALGRIDYGDGEEGWLVYVKSTLTGDEDPLILDYRRFHPEFPHQSTAEQFFDERRFEMYRALGFHSIEETLTDLLENRQVVVTGDDDPDQMERRTEWYERARRDILAALPLAPAWVAERRSAPGVQVT